MVENDIKARASKLKAIGDVIIGACESADDEKQAMAILISTLVRMAAKRINDPIAYIRRLLDRMELDLK